MISFSAVTSDMLKLWSISEHQGITNSLRCMKKYLLYVYYVLEAFIKLELYSCTSGRDFMTYIF